MSKDQMEWFNEIPAILREAMIAINEKWICPEKDCGGEMESTGSMWPTGTPGYHHICNKCGFAAAMRGKSYPRIIYKKSG